MNRIFYLSILAALVTLNVTAQPSSERKDVKISPEQKHNTIQEINRILNERYIFPDVARRISNYLVMNERKRAYAEINDGREFANRLTHDMQTAGNDKHLRAEYFEESLDQEPERELMSIPDEEREGLAAMLQHTNYGINKIDVLKGNIGYIDFNVFVTPEIAGEKYAAAMSYVSHTDALIIDLRNCGGSMSPDAVPFLCSYFFQSPVHLNNIAYRKDNKVMQSYTYAVVPGKKYLEKPIYVLTSKRTFSGAEELAYDLKNLKRAMLIGQPTGGGANPGGDIRVNEHFRIFVPVGQAINPITKTNWEHVGVQPDVAVDTRLALYEAQRLAMHNTINTTKEKIWKDALTEWVKELEQTKPLFKPVTFELNGYEDAKNVFVAGSFNGWSANDCRLERKAGKWAVTATTEPGRVSYKFIVDGKWITDPANQAVDGSGPDANSLKIVN